MSLIDKVHGGYVFSRRVKVLSERLAELIPQNATVLDVGCGDGTLDKLIMDKRNDLSIKGIDVLVRPLTHIPVENFDGHTIPYADNEFDVVMFVDVLHHTDEPSELLREAKRVAKKVVVIKDHTKNGLLANTTLRFMDWVGNARHGVVLPYNYWTHQKWLDTVEKLDMRIQVWNAKIGLYPFPANWIFERSLHFVAQIDTTNQSSH
jgi:ubiquinone/menaquinone biosynthesis C-methylase UbiE